MPKNVKGGLWDFLTSIVLQDIETNEGETLWCSPKNFKKSPCRKNPSEKRQRGDPSYVFQVLDVDIFVLDEVPAFRVLDVRSPS